MQKRFFVFLLKTKNLSAIPLHLLPYSHLSPDSARKNFNEAAPGTAYCHSADCSQVMSSALNYRLSAPDDSL